MINLLPTEPLDEEGGNNDENRSKGIRQNVKEDT